MINIKKRKEPELIFEGEKIRKKEIEKRRKLGDVYLGGMILSRKRWRELTR